MKFLVVTNAPTLYKDGKYVAYAPYVKELDIWFRNVDEIGIISPDEYPKSIFLKSFLRQDIKYFKIPFFELSNAINIVRFLIFLPLIIIRIIQSFIWADHIHLRCPGNIGLLGSLIQVLFPQKQKTVKYAGNWDPEAKQPWSYRMQKWILSNTFLTRNLTVLVYGNWPNQSKNILPFFTASFSENERELINKEITGPHKFLFVGNLARGKQPGIAIEIVHHLYKRNIQAQLHIYGEGELLSSLQDQAKSKDYIHFHGNQPLKVLKQAFKDVHFLILASKSEGWPKAVAEAMWFGCIPIATAVSCVPWMLGEGSRGILISHGNNRNGNSVNSEEWIVDSQDGLGKVDGGLSETPSFRYVRLEVTESGNILDDTVNKIIELINNPEEMKRMSMEAQEWSQQYTLEGFEEEIKKLLVPKEVRH